MKPLYKIGQRISFIVRNECTIDNKIVKGKWTHFVGYVKQVRRSLLGVCYVVNVAKTADIYIVSQRDIIGIVEKRENLNKTNNTDENGNI